MPRFAAKRKMKGSQTHAGAGITQEGHAGCMGRAGILPAASDEGRASFSNSPPETSAKKDRHGKEGCPRNTRKARKGGWFAENLPCLSCIPWTIFCGAPWRGMSQRSPRVMSEVPGRIPGTAGCKPALPAQMPVSLWDVPFRRMFAAISGL